MFIVKETVFVNNDGWHCIVGNKVFGPFCDRGAALAGLATEQKRKAKREKILQSSKIEEKV